MKSIGFVITKCLPLSALYWGPYPPFYQCSGWQRAAAPQFLSHAGAPSAACSHFGTWPFLKAFLWYRVIRQDFKGYISYLLFWSFYSLISPPAMIILGFSWPSLFSMILFFLALHLIYFCLALSESGNISGTIMVPESGTGLSFSPASHCDLIFIMNLVMRKGVGQTLKELCTIFKTLTEIIEVLLQAQRIKGNLGIWYFGVHQPSYPYPICQNFIFFLAWPWPCYRKPVQLKSNLL